MDNNTRAALVLSIFKRDNNFDLDKILNESISYSEILKLPINTLEKYGFSKVEAMALKEIDKSFCINSYLKYLQINGINYCCLGQDKYPKSLLSIYNPPIVLYYRGEIEYDYDSSLAIVGGRIHSNYVNVILRDIKKVVRSYNLVIVSGLAIGTDSLAHKLALASNCKTIAIIGSGLDYDSFYPKSNWLLAKQIVSNNGLLISEYPPHTKANKLNFPRRNRIIAGLSKTVMVLEARYRSGALITAREASEQWKEVVSVPGNYYLEYSKGTNWLISQGAKIYCSDKDLAELYKQLDT